MLVVLCDVWCNVTPLSPNGRESPEGGGFPKGGNSKTEPEAQEVPEVHSQQHEITSHNIMSNNNDKQQQQQWLTLGCLFISYS